ncbi:hypothetical protein ALI144C_05180 [Actinosynnema sp. ALI-1.44]|nr:hypothetical protein ALI144C_05180 [Actinosynnema sp. ALI-1.44]
MDLTPPDKHPQVSSSDYPENAEPPGFGGAGVPGRFTLGPNGVSDVVGYYINGTYVAADRLGGGATVNYAPQNDGPVSIAVSSVDRARHHSPTTYYRTWVASTGPDVTCPKRTGLLPFQCVFKAVRVPDAATFTYRVGNGPETTVPAVNGVATVDITATMGEHVLYAWSTSSAGVRSGFETVGLDVRDSPIVSSDVYPEDGNGGGGAGVPGEFVFEPGMPGVATYRYSLDPDVHPESGTVPAGPDGTATVTLTPKRAGFVTLDVWSVNADGSRSTMTARYQFFVSG